MKKNIKKSTKKSTKKNKTTIYIVSKSQPDYDCGSTWVSLVNNKGYKTMKSAYKAMIDDMLEKMGLDSIDQVPDPNGSDYAAMDKLRKYGIEDWGIPTNPGDFMHKTCDGYIQTCDGEITYDIQALEIED